MMSGVAGFIYFIINSLKLHFFTFTPSSSIVPRSITPNITHKRHLVASCDNKLTSVQYALLIDKNVLHVVFIGP